MNRPRFSSSTGDLVGFAGEPAEDVAGFAKLIAEVCWHSRWCGGALRRRGGFGRDLSSGRRATAGRRQGHWGWLPADQCPGPGERGASLGACFQQALREHGFDELTWPGDGER